VQDSFARVLAYVLIFGVDKLNTKGASHMRYLVTGAAGFVGFHVAKRLLDDGHSVFGYDAMTTYYDIALKQERLRILQTYQAYDHTTAFLEDFDTLLKVATEANPNVIVHLAAQAGVRYSLENPRAYVDSNLVGSFNVLEIARILKPDHLLLASTSSVYGANAKVPFEETDKTDEPLTLYAATKKSMEVMAHSYAHLWQIPTTVFRFFTVYGPYGRPDMALFKFVDATLRGKPIDVYGEGKQERDFTYVEDLVETIVRLAAVSPVLGDLKICEGDTLSPLGPYRIVNLGGGAPVGLLPFIDTIEETLNMPVQRNLMKMQKGDVPRTYSSTILLEAITGFVPKTPVKKGVKAFVDWFKQSWQVTPEV
jgi:UDP-glucuronate 4-epimerase